MYFFIHPAYICPKEKLIRSNVSHSIHQGISLRPTVTASNNIPELFKQVAKLSLNTNTFSRFAYLPAIEKGNVARIKFNQFLKTEIVTFWKTFDP